MIHQTPMDSDVHVETHVTSSVTANIVSSSSDAKMQMEAMEAPTEKTFDRIERTISAITIGGVAPHTRGTSLYFLCI
jgi:hypothetical protein